MRVFWTKIGKSDGEKWNEVRSDSEIFTITNQNFDTRNIETWKNNTIKEEKKNQSENEQAKSVGE